MCDNEEQMWQKIPHSNTYAHQAFVPKRKLEEWTLAFGENKWIIGLRYNKLGWAHNEREHSAFKMDKNWLRPNKNELVEC